MPVAGVTGTVTRTLITQVLLGANVPCAKESDVSPALGVKVGVPQPEVVALGGAATSMLPGTVGRVSEKLRPVRVDGVGLVKTKVSVEEPPGTVLLGEKALASVTWAGSTIDAMRAELEKSLL